MSDRKVCTNKWFLWEMTANCKIIIALLSSLYYISDLVYNNRKIKVQRQKQINHTLTTFIHSWFFLRLSVKTIFSINVKWKSYCRKINQYHSYHQTNHRVWFWIHRRVTIHQRRLFISFYHLWKRIIQIGNTWLVTFLTTQTLTMPYE